MQQVRVSVVIPARNEAATIASVVSALIDHPMVDEILVCDSASSDDTGVRAAASGARVVRLDIPGFGRAVKAGFAEAKNDWIFKLDGDMRNVQRSWLNQHLDALRDGVGLVKSLWDNPEDPMPVTNLVVKPAIKLHLPELSFISMPISGIYLCNKEFIKGQVLGDDFTHDLDLLIRIHRAGGEIVQVHLGQVFDNLKPLSNYFEMAGEMLRCAAEHGRVRQSEPVMFVMAHADDAEIWCGGTLLRALQMGARVDLWIASADPVRQHEALALTQIFNNLRVKFLGCSEFEVQASSSAISRLSVAIDELQPKTLITHHYCDDHPDHRACFELATAACIKVDRRRMPSAIYLCNSYFQSSVSGAFQPNTFIDITDQAELKIRMLAHHASQDVGHWSRMVSAMDALTGAKCGVGMAEAFQKISVYTSPPPDSFL